MHFICSPFGSSGDVYPLLGLALALKQRGHRITFVVNGHFEEVVRRYGLDFVELGTRQEFLASTNHPDLWNPFRGFRHIWKHLIQPSLRNQYAIFSQLHRTGETIGIANCFGFGALVAQDKVGIPVITAHLQPAVIWSDLEPPQMLGSFGPLWWRRLQYRVGERFFIDPVVCPDLNRFRAQLGLSPVRQITRWWHSKWCIACLFPDWYCPPQADWPNNVIQTDFPLWDEPTDAGLPAEVESFLAEGEAPIAFTPGSANIFGKEFFNTAVEVCQRLNRRGLLLTRFPEQIERPLPPTVRHFDYVPFSALLPRTAAVVHHGGIGSMAQGLAAGVPQLVMALAHDQFDNAARLKRFGVGDWVKQSQFRPRLITKKLQALLDSREVEQNCRELAQRLCRRDGLDRTAASIEEFAARHNRERLAASQG